jgi:hypothetical protein
LFDGKWKMEDGRGGFFLCFEMHLQIGTFTHLHILHLTLSPPGLMEDGKGKMEDVGFSYVLKCICR